jgi:hypothetical protein
MVNECRHLQFKLLFFLYILLLIVCLHPLMSVSVVDDVTRVNMSCFYGRMNMAYHHVIVVTRGQFHQHFGAKRKCAGSHSSAPVGTI